jgi:hypothetical protein
MIGVQQKREIGSKAEPGVPFLTGRGEEDKLGLQLPWEVGEVRAVSETSCIAHLVPKVRKEIMVFEGRKSSCILRSGVAPPNDNLPPTPFCWALGEHLLPPVS